MALLTFCLSNPRLKFSATEESDEWDYSLAGKWDRSSRLKSFTVECGNNSFNGFDAEASVYIKKRLPRSEVPGIPIPKPFDKDDKNRDTIHVTCPDSSDEHPYFQISVSLPPDAYQRVIEADWTTQTFYLLIDTGLFEKTIIYGNDPDGLDVIWLADKCNYAYLEDVTVVVMTAHSQKVCLEEKPPQTEPVAGKALTAIEQMLVAVDRLTESNRELRSSITKAAWVLAAVLIVTAFIR